ncbi:GrlR family regulatory protein [Ketogulonicigenium vulgare]|uniref:GrlR family regulatory protein n=1 Tax=Ketogulonicigenium vulgare TaxID=92945 RepID=UPI0023593815|nr:GrlR family regulatory protein [Ketogulonicigenium vulgare]
MIDGFYTVQFQTPMGMGGGTLTLRNGKIQGGDSTMLYRGAYSSANSQLSASISVTTHLHVPGNVTVFGVPEVELNITAEDAGTGNFNGTATSPQAPGISMTFVMRKVPD